MVNEIVEVKGVKYEVIGFRSPVRGETYLSTGIGENDTKLVIRGFGNHHPDEPKDRRKILRVIEP